MVEFTGEGDLKTNEGVDLGDDNWSPGSIRVEIPMEGRQMSQKSQDERPDNLDYLSEMEDGCGCAELWEHLSERRNEKD